MKRVRAKLNFTDNSCNGLRRRLGDIFIVDDERAKVLVEHGFAQVVEEIIPAEPEVETAVKVEPMKETAEVKPVKKKETKTAIKEELKKKVIKKNAKK